MVIVGDIIVGEIERDDNDICGMPMITRKPTMTFVATNDALLEKP